MSAGRPTRLTRERIKNISALVAAGNTQEVAVAASAVSKSAFYNWMTRGRAEAEKIANGGTPDPKNRIYVELVDSIEKAHAEAEARMVSVVRTAAMDGTWQAACWWLERTRHETYAKKDRSEVTTVITGAVDSLAKVIDAAPALPGEAAHTLPAIDEQEAA